MKYSISIIPNNYTERCEAEQCYTINQLAGERLNKSSSDVKLVLHFLPGKHFLNSHLNISSVAVVQMIGFSDSAVWIQNGSLTLSYVQHLKIRDLKFVSTIDWLKYYAIRIDQSGNVLLARCILVETTISITDSNSTTMYECVFNNTLNIKSSINALKVSTKYFLLVSCMFFDNKLYNDDIYTVDMYNSEYLVISQCNFASDGRGRIRINASDIDNGIMKITNCEFTANNPNSYRGIVYITNATYNWTTSSFTNNTITNGGAVSWGNELTIVNCTFTGNHGDHDVGKGVVQISSIDSLHIIDCEFSSNNKTALFADVDYRLYIANSTFTNNYGIVIHSYNVFVHITSCKFANNIGSGISISEADNIRVEDCIFTNNTSEHAIGGAIRILYNSSDRSYLRIVNSVILFSNCDNHNELWSGGALFVEKSIVNITDTVFRSNYGTNPVTFVQSKVIMENTTFIHNNASNHRVLSLLQSTLELKQVVFNENKGFIYLFNSYMDVLGAMTLSGNTGGAMQAILSQICVKSAEKVVISNNTASSGGGMLLKESDLFIESPIVVSGNMADTFGGGIIALPKCN